MQTRQSLTNRLDELKSQGVAMIGVFHHPEDVEHLIDDQIQMHIPDPHLNSVTLEEIQG
jgi:alpha-D-ribose 1-methylphosphonate 5-triphosphate synthase subunit PhnL